MTDLADLDNADLVETWLRELVTVVRDPDPALVASLEAEANRRGFDCLDVAEALVAADFSPDLHPRGRDGKFIEKFGNVELFDVIEKSGLLGRKKRDLSHARGKVVDIVPDPKTPGHPNVHVRGKDAGGKDFDVVVKPDKIGAAPEKARLDITGKPRPLSVSQQIDQSRRDRGFNVPGTTTKIDRGLFDEPRDRRFGPADEGLRRRDEAARARVRAGETMMVNGKEIRLDRGGVPPETPGPLPTLENRRTALVATINAAAANLSTTDATERGNGLDEMLAKLRFSIIDTDQVHDRISPPEGDSGRWTPERHAQHEQMWEDLLSQIESAGIPEEHDAFVLGGLPGAGKSSALRPGGAAADLGVVAWETNAPIPAGATHVSINPDVVKEMLIARGMLPEGISPDLKPMEQVTFLHEESSYLAKQFSKRLGDQGYNVVLDNTMDSESGMLKRMTPLARQGYTFRALFADIPVEESLASTKARYEADALTPMGGRFVPSSVQGNRTSTKGNLSKNRDAMDDLVAADWFTNWMVIDNSGISQGNPKREISGQGVGGGTAVEKWKGDLEAPGISAPATTAIGGPNVSTISPDEVTHLASEVQAGRPISVEPVNLDDVISVFADSPTPVDLTLVEAFSAMRATGVPSSKMPQIHKEHRSAFQDRLRADGHAFTPETIDPQRLTATQSELDGRNTGEMLRDTRSGQFDLIGRPVWISSDDKVLDGHHRWAAALALSANCGGCVEMPVIRVDMPMSELLTYADGFNTDMGVQHLGFGESTNVPAAPAVAAGTPVPVPDETGNFDMATDTEDGITEADLATLSHGDGSAFT